MANFAYRSAVQVDDSSGSSATANATLPSGTTSGDGQIIGYMSGVVTGGGAPTHTTPSGWTLVGSSTFTNISGLDGRFSLFAKVAGGSEGTVTLTSNKNCFHTVRRLTYQNANATDFVSGISPTFATTASSTSHAVASVTPGRANAMAWYMLVGLSAVATWTAASGTTERTDQQSTCTDDLIQTTAGATGSKTFTCSATNRCATVVAVFYSSSSLNIQSADGISDGAGSAAGVGASTAEAIGSSSGSATAAAVGASIAASAGTCTATATVTGVGSSEIAASGAGTASGSATVSGVGASTASSDGSGLGAATAVGIGASTAAAVGDSAGTGTVAGVGSSTSSAGSVGTSTGSAAANAVGASTASAVGTAVGSGTAAGAAPAVEPPAQAQPSAATRGVRLSPRLYVVIDGQRYTGSREDILALVAEQARRQADAEPAAPSTKKAKAAARRAARQAPQIVAEGLPDRIDVSPSPALQALLRELEEARREARIAFEREYLARLMLVRQLIEADNDAAIAAAEMML